MSLQERMRYAEMKARHQQALKPWHKKWWGWLSIALGIVFLAFLAFYGSIYLKQTLAFLKGTAEVVSPEEEKAAYLQAINGDGTNYFTGPENAKVTIIEFGDFACPYCRQSAPGIRKIAADYKDQVKIVFRDYPLHENSIDLALAARCAGLQGKFWEMHDKFYLEHEPISATGAELQAILVTLAANLNISTKAFEQCLLDRSLVAKIKKDFDDAELLGVEGTPTWFINNNDVLGYIPEDRLREIIDGLLASY